MTTQEIIKLSPIGRLQRSILAIEAQMREELTHHKNRHSLSYEILAEELKDARHIRKYMYDDLTLQFKVALHMIHNSTTSNRIHTALTHYIEEELS